MTLHRPYCRQFLVATLTPDRTVRVSETPDRAAITLAVVHGTYEVLVHLSKEQWLALTDARYSLIVEPDCEPPKPLPITNADEVQP